MVLDFLNLIASKIYTWKVYKNGEVCIFKVIKNKIPKVTQIDIKENQPIIWEGLSELYFYNLNNSNILIIDNESKYVIPLIYRDIFPYNYLVKIYPDGEMKNVQVDNNSIINGIKRTTINNFDALNITLNNSSLVISTDKFNRIILDIKVKDKTLRDFHSYLRTFDKEKNMPLQIMQCPLDF